MFANICLFFTRGFFLIFYVLYSRVVDPYSFFTDPDPDPVDPEPDPVDPDGGQYGSGSGSGSRALMTKY